MKIIISGASGLIGKPLVKNLRKHGHDVIQLVRRAPLLNESQWNPATGQIDASIIDGADAVIHLSGAGIGDRRWTVVHDELAESLRGHVCEDF